MIADLGMTLISFALMSSLLTCGILESVQEGDAVKMTLVINCVILTGLYLLWKRRAIVHRNRLVKFDRLLREGGLFVQRGDKEVVLPLPPEIAEAFASPPAEEGNAGQKECDCGGKCQAKTTEDVELVHGADSSEVRDDRKAPTQSSV